MAQISFTWTVPGQMVGTVATVVAPTVQATRDGLANVVRRVPYVVVGVDPDDASAAGTAYISHSVELGEPDPDNFTDVSGMDRATLFAWLQARLFATLSQPDQESQVAKKIRDQQASPAPLPLPPSAG